MSDISKNKIKWIRSFQMKKTRDDEGLYVVEGEKMIGEVVTLFPELIHTLIHTEDFIINRDLPSADIYSVNRVSLEQASGLKTPNKALAVLRKQTYPLPDPDQLIIALDAVQDPGNLGTILRIADWFGIKHIVCSTSTVEVYNPKVVQASMGAILRIKVHYTDLNEFLTNYPEPVYGALLEGENIFKTQLTPKGVILLGNEGKGVSEELQKRVTKKISIPRFGQAESLNVSVATGIIVSEFKRLTF